ncbi:MAG TPA: hypothetical protein VFB38_17665 [Chthonomonadaceae bacterium]|nr:hypothetical protein [Chthonomonadaceae bacterium]
MSKATLDKVVEELKGLSPEEQRQVRDLLDAWLSVPASSAGEQALAQALLKAGLLSHIPPPITDLTPYPNRTPIPVRGKLVSETLVEEQG